MDECFTFIESCLEKRHSTEHKIIKPVEYESSCKVMKIER